MSDSRLRPERWQQIDELWQAALERPEEQRAAFLDQACAGNEELRREVDSLLAHHAQAGSFLESPPADAAADVLAQEKERLTEGQRIAHYRTGSLLGAGGMGEVYLAEDTRLRRQVALKLLPARFTENQDRVVRFEQEARAASALNHPNIVTIHEIGHIEGKHFIVTEFIEGETLRQRMTAKSMSLRETLDAAIQVASALSAAHAAGIIHRDIKPENIMLRPDGLIKVLDFGLAKLVEDQSPILDPGNQDTSIKAGTNTETRTVLGTLRYMSPEQAMGQPVDTRTDIFSLGVVLYEMVTGSSPFRGSTSLEVLTAIQKEDPPPLTEAVPGTPSELEWIETKALAKERDERYQTVKELQIDLKRLKQELELKQKLDSRAPARVVDSGRVRDDSQTADSSDHARRRKIATLLRLGALTALTLLAFYTGIRLASPPAPPERQLLTFRSGNVNRARFAADGSTVFYSAAFERGPIQTYRMGVDSGAEFSEFGPAGAGLQSVSKTHVYLLLGCTMDYGECHNGKLASLPINGDNTAPTEIRDEVWEAEWSEAAGALAIISMRDGSFQLEYPMGTVLLQSPDRLSHLRVSPDGKMVAYIDHLKLDDLAGSVKIISDQKGKQIIESTHWRTIRSLAWTPKGDKVLFSGGDSRSEALRSLTLAGEHELVAPVPQIEDVSRKGEILGITGIRRSRIGGVTRDPRDLSWFDASQAADLSSDGMTFLFYEWGSAVRGKPQVYLRKLDGKSGPTKLGPGRALALSPNGDSVLALQPASPDDPGSPDRLVLIPTGETENTRELRRGTIGEYLWASWFPDGNQILITGVEEGQQYARSYVQDLQDPEGLPQYITEEGYVAMLLSPDMKKLVVRHPNDEKYYFHEYPVRSDGPEPVLIPGLKRGDEPIQWNKDATALYVRGPEVRGRENLYADILQVDIRSGARTPSKKIELPDPVGNIGVTGRVLITPDGNSYVCTFWTVMNQLSLTKGLKF